MGKSTYQESESYRLSIANPFDDIYEEMRAIKELILSFPNVWKSPLPHPTHMCPALTIISIKRIRRRMELPLLGLI